MKTTAYTIEHREVPVAALLTINMSVPSARGRSVVVEIRRPADSEDARRPANPQETETPRPLPDSHPV